MKKLILLISLLTTFTAASYAQNTCLTAQPVTAGVYTVDQIDGNDPPILTICPPSTGPATMAEWYSFYADQDTTVTVSTDLAQNFGRDTRINVYSGACGPFTQVCAGGDDDSGTGLLAIAEFQAIQGFTYYIVFDNFWEADGFDFEISLGGPVVGAVSFTPETQPCAGCGRCVVDMNGDHLDDLVGISSTNIDMHIQQAGGGFASSSVTTTEADHPASWSMCAGDLDNNGFTDLVYAGGAGATMMMANSDGTAFTEISPEQYIFPQRSNTVDINNDGLLDVFVCHDVDSNVYFINDGVGGFITHQGGLGDIPVGGNYGSIWSDMDNDGDIDMFIAKCGSHNINELHVNNGDGTYTEMASSFNLDDPIQTWSCAVGDFDNDGDMDVVVGASSGTHRVSRNDGITFADVTAGSGFDLFGGTSIEWVTKDFDNDGNLDVMGAGGMMMGNGNLTFTYNPTSIMNGPIGDLNHDGFLDIVNGSTIHYNDGNDNNWIKIHTVGTVSNIQGIGARVEIHTPAGMQIRDIRSGEGFGHMNSLTANFGIGTETQVDLVRVIWPSGIVNTFDDPTINESLVVVENEGLGIGDNGSPLGFTIYPNPTDKIITLEGLENQARAVYSVRNMIGQEVMSKPMVGNSIDVSRLEVGMYQVSVRLEDGNLLQQQFVKAE
jgi:hypothetical protein